jgi:cytoskeletal protein CcmA (bactofilin family)
MRIPALVAALCVAAVGAAGAQDFNWHGRIAQGKRLEIKGVNGDVRAVLASGGEAVVNASKRSRRSDPDEVEIKVIEHEDGVTICAVYPTPPRARRENSCEPGERWHSSTEDNDVTVNFEVQVPAGVVFDGRTVNGEMSAEGLRADVKAVTVNGSVRVSTTGLAEASTVNGSVHAQMGRADWSDELDFSTVNGGITLILPSKLDTEVRANTVNGDIDSDYPLMITGKFGPRQVRGTIGAGGRSLSLSTVNGGIKLRRST